MATSEGRILSQPIGVEWAGWRSDTLMLQRCGWQLAVNFDPYRYQYQLIMRHEGMKLCAISDELTIQNAIGRGSYPLQDLPVFRVRHVAPDIRARMVSMSMDVWNPEAIDATPQYVQEKIVSIYDLNVFATKRTEQVLVDKADMTVIEHLEAIKRMQSPKQLEIRKREMEQPSETPRLHLVAQLVHYSEAA